MCDPVTLSIAATAMAAAGTISSTMSAVQQSRYEAKVADFNKGLENQKVADAVTRGDIATRDAQRRQSAMLGAQRAAMAANGIDVSFGSASDFLADTAMMGQDERLNIKENVRREQMGYDINAANYDAKANAARSAAKGALIAGAFQLGSTLAAGAQKVGKINADRAGKTNTGW